MPKSKTIWIINQYASTPETGMGGRHYYIAKALADQGYNVYLVAAGYHHFLRKLPQVKANLTFEKQDGFTFVWTKVPQYPDAQNIRRVFNWAVFAYRLTRLKRVVRDRPDIILCSSPSLTAYLGARNLARYFQAKLVFEVRDIWPLTFIEVGGYSSRHPFIRFLQWIEDMAYRESDQVVSNLKMSIKHMMSRGMPPGKFVWVPNGFCLSEANIQAPLSEAVEGLIPNDKFVVGYAGTLGVANALQSLLEAAKTLKDEKNIAFVIVGHGKQKEELQEFSDKHALKNVIFINSVPKSQIQALLSRFDASYIGLLNEPLFRFGVSPNKLFDYLYAGKPIIYAIDSGHYHPILDANAGFEIPPEDPAAIVEAIWKLLALSIDDREKMGLAGKAYVMEHHEYTQLTKRLIDTVIEPETSSL